MKTAVAKYIDISETETFIRAHCRHLPETMLIQGYPPRIGDAPASLVERGTRFLHRQTGRLWNRDNEFERTPEYVRLLRFTRPDVVLAEYGQTGVLIAEACQQLGLPYVVHFHGFDAHGAAVLEQYRDTYPPMLRSAAAIVAVSRTMRAQLIELGGPEQRVFLNPYGVDVHSFEPRSASSSSAAAPDEALKFLAVGRFVDKKAPHLTLLAFADVLREHPGVRLQMIGDGRLLDPCKDLAIALGIEEAVAFSGAQPHDAVRVAMRSADVFVQHSVTAQGGDSEGSPVAITEAGASGLPVVSTCHAGIPDIVADGDTGFLVEERDIEGMAQKMIRLAEDRTRREAMGAQARQRIEHCFSTEKSVGRLAQILRWTTDGRRARPALLPTWMKEPQADASAK